MSLGCFAHRLLLVSVTVMVVTAPFVRLVAMLGSAAVATTFLMLGSSSVLPGPRVVPASPTIIVYFVFVAVPAAPRCALAILPTFECGTALI